MKTTFLLLVCLQLVSCNRPPQPYIGKRIPAGSDSDPKSKTDRDAEADAGSVKNRTPKVESPSEKDDTEADDPKEQPTTSMPPKEDVPASSALLSKDLLDKSGFGQLNSDKTPLGKLFEKAVEMNLTLEQKGFLLDPNQNPPVESELTGWSYKPITVKLYPRGDRPRLGDGYQTSIGDCNMLAMLNGFAYQHPDFLKSLIADKGDGTYRVKMFYPDGTRFEMGIDNKFLADNNGNLLAARGPGGVAIWLTILEKAIMKYNYIYKIWGGGAPAGVGGFGPHAGSPMLVGTGNAYGFGRGVLKTTEEYSRAVKEALAAGKVMTGGFGKVMATHGVEAVLGHAFTMMYPSNQQTLVTMRNPWGVAAKEGGGYDTSNEGIMDIPITKEWLDNIDLGIMEPGIAGVSGQTSPYNKAVSFTSDLAMSAEDFAYFVHAKEKYKGN